MNNTGCLDLNHMPQIPEADFSVLKSHVISAHYTGIGTESLLCVFLCNFLCSLVHKNTAKWVWLSNLLKNSFDFKMAMHFQLVYIQSSQMCVIYGQISATVLFVNSKHPWKHGCYHGKVKKPASLPWCSNETKHYINHINVTHPQSWQTPTLVPQEVQVHIVKVL